MRAGIVVAVETGAVRRTFGETEEKKRMGGFRVYVYRQGDLEIFVITGCAGEIAAAAGCQALISEASVDIVINAGVAGGLSGEYEPGKIIIVDNVVHYDYDSSKAGGAGQGCYPFLPGPYIPVTDGLVRAAEKLFPDALTGTCASGDKFVDSGAGKAELNRKFMASVCDMEAAGVALTCLRNRIPVLILKAVSDGPEEGFAEGNRNFESASDLVMDAVKQILTERRDA
ncbi:MAG: 5'-methylthioadenosine/S-adenosylhomocysteine nucleosidase [Clostridia bacterium]|nr:5'-methylthioadenosine/S-adenosylhomocysteine nucleosidase [Clostridia bacterium]